MKIKELYESTTSGSIAPGTPAKVGKMQKRAGSLFKGKVTNKPFYEAEVNEEEIVEQDLILVPDQIIKKDKSFVTHEKDRRDHEVEMARSELFAAAKDAQRVYAMLKNRTEDEGLMGWQQSYITLAADYLNSVADSLEHQAHTNEMTGGVLAGGMSNFEEGVRDLGYDAQSLIMKLRRDIEEKRLQPTPQAVLAAARELAGDMDFAPQLLVKQVLGQGVAEGKCVECGGPSYSEEHIAEAKDACYNKVKSRYKVWPSAYASGALVKCRKVGASNWGNKSKK